MWRQIISILTIILINSTSTEFLIFTISVDFKDLPVFGVVETEHEALLLRSWLGCTSNTKDINMAFSKVSGNIRRLCDTYDEIDKIPTCNENTPATANGVMASWG